MGWQHKLIEQGNYFYAFSHIPAHELAIKKNIMKITCFRDPAKRVISHYNMIKYYQINNIQHPAMLEEGKWLGENFSDFLKNIPREHLLRQLYMFSANYNKEEAIEFLGKNKIEILFTETLNEDMQKLSAKIGYTFSMRREKKYDYKENITDSENSLLTEKLEREYLFMEEVKKLL